MAYSSSKRPNRAIKVGNLIKMSVVKNSSLSSQNFKTRLFELTAEQLKYYSGDVQCQGKLKGSINLNTIKVIKEVHNGSLAGKNNVFQIVFENGRKNNYFTLYVTARTDAERQAWISAITTEATKCRAAFFNKHHSGVWTKKLGHYNCCFQNDRNAPGCIIDHLLSSLSSPPSQPTQVSSVSLLPPVQPPVNPKKVYIAVFDYEPLEEEDLELIQGERYTILEETSENWWLAVNKDGEKGHIPVTYIRPNCGLDIYEWYYKNLTRERSQTILMNTRKEGCFLVRDSISQPGEYTLDVYTLEDEGTVRRYRISQSKGMFYVDVSHTQPTIPELIKYHMHNSGGLKTRLREPPPRGKRPSTAGLGYGRWELDPSHLVPGKELGRGYYGVVYEGVYRKGRNNLQVAIKELTKPPTSDEFVQEFKMMTELHHPNLVQLYGVVLKGSSQKLVTELLIGPLKTHLTNHKPDLEKNPMRLLGYCLQVCCGMCYLEERRILHRDLAARNCLVGRGDVIKVGDFGLARMVLADDEYTLSEGSQFSFKWVPPEVLTHRKFSSKSDIWAFGILMWETYSLGSTPYPNMNHSDIVKNVAEQRKRLAKPRLATEFVYGIMKTCWEHEASDRPDFKTLKSKLSSLITKDTYIVT